MVASLLVMLFASNPLVLAVLVLGIMVGIFRGSVLPALLGVAAAVTLVSIVLLVHHSTRAAPAPRGHRA